MLRIWLPTRDASRIYGVPERTIRRWHTEQRLTGKRIGRRWYWDAWEVEQLATIRDDTPSIHLPKRRK